jgi:hypothetical protein
MLAPASSFRDDAEPFLQGECVLLRFPAASDIPQPDDTAPTGSARLPLTTNASSPQHAFIRSAVLRDDASYDVTAYPVISLSRQGGAIQGYNNLPANVKTLPYFTPAAVDTLFNSWSFRKCFDSHRRLRTRKRFMASRQSAHVHNARKQTSKPPSFFLSAVCKFLLPSSA